MKKKSPIKEISIKMTTLETVLKGEDSPVGCSAVLELLHQALQKNSTLIFVEDDRTGRRYRLTKRGLVELCPRTR